MGTISIKNMKFNLCVSKQRNLNDWRLFLCSMKGTVFQLKELIHLCFLGYSQLMESPITTSMHDWEIPVGIVFCWDRLSRKLLEHILFYQSTCWWCQQQKWCVLDYPEKWLTIKGETFTRQYLERSCEHFVNNATRKHLRHVVQPPFIGDLGDMTNHEYLLRFAMLRKAQMLTQTLRKASISY